MTPGMCQSNGETVYRVCLKYVLFLFASVLDHVMRDERSKTFQGIPLDLSLDYDI